MGLDMYFYARKHENNCNGKELTYPTELDKLMKAKDDNYFLKYETYEIGYFRKFNALHSYIVNHFANGVDKCQEIYLSYENLKELYNICNKVLEDNSLAPELLPTQAGFFFGSLEYDSYYFENVRQAVELFKSIIGFEETNLKYDCYYNASW